MKLVNNLYAYPEQGMLDCNTYVITGKPGIIIDPGNPEYLETKVEDIRRDGLDPKTIGLILNTHLHIDHCGANEAFKQLSGARIALHPVQKQNYKLVVVDGARFFGMTPGEFTEDDILEEGSLKVGAAEIEMIEAPGHSPDCVCYYLRAEKILIGGDVVFERNTGRVDLPGGSADDLKKSIEALSQMDIHHLLPGHMGIVSGAEAVAANFAFIKSNVFPWL